MRADADAHRLAGLAVAHEDVVRAVRVAPDEVGRRRVEGDETPVGRDRRAEAVAVALYAVRVDADARGLAGLAVAHEDVGRAVRVAADEVGRDRLEGDETPVGGDRGSGAEEVALYAVRVDADARGLAGLEIAHEDVLRRGRVARDAIARR